MSEEFIEIKETNGTIENDDKSATTEETNGTIENDDKSATTEETKELTLIKEIKREIEKITSAQSELKDDVRKINDNMYNAFSKGGENKPEPKNDFNSFIERL